MPHSGYSRMGIIRTSPHTGEALRRLNVFEGQVLHGRIYQVEPLSQSAALTAGGSKLAKIALGSLLIEAIVSKPIQEGSHVQLEVLKLADESFVLKLLSVETPKQGESSQNAFSAGSARTFETPQPDIVELSSAARETVSQQSDRPAPQVEQNVQTKLVEPPNWTGLPRPVLTAVRAAITEGFINPTGFTARVSVMKEAVLHVIENFQSTVRQVAPQTQSQPQAPVVKELTDSIQSLTNIIRPIVIAIPAEQIPLEEPIPVVAKQISQIAATLRPSMQAVQTEVSVRAPVSPAPVPTATTQVPVEPPQTLSTGTTPVTQSTIPSPSTQPSTTPIITPAPATPVTASAPVTTPAPVAGPGTTPEAAPPATPVTASAPVTTPAPVAGPGTTPEVAPPATPAIASTPVTSSAPVAGPGTIPGVELPPAPIPAGSEATAVPGDSVRGTLGARSEITQLTAEQPARELLFGMRTLSMLAERLASQKGWSLEHAADLQAHAVRLTTISDAWEGTLLAPLLTRSLDVADAIPRLLLSLLFPGGVAEFCALRSDRADADEYGRGSDTQERGDDGEYVGIIHLTTEGLGNLNVRLDFKEADERNIVSGRFGVSEEASAVIQPAIPSLERALDARGIESGGFKVVPIGKERQSDGNAESKETENNGSLDVRI